MPWPDTPRSSSSSSGVFSAKAWPAASASASAMRVRCFMGGSSGAGPELDVDVVDLQRGDAGGAQVGRGGDAGGRVRERDVGDAQCRGGHRVGGGRPADL